MSQSSSATPSEDGDEAVTLSRFRRALQNIRQEIDGFAQQFNEIRQGNDERDDRLDDHAEEIAELKAQLAALEADTEYADLTLDEKVGRVRKHAFRRAVDNGGRVELNYEDVGWGVFDGEPADSHCYKLMRRAGETWDGDGFTYRDLKRGSYALRVDADAVRRETVGTDFSEKKDAVAGGGGR